MEAIAFIQWMDNKQFFRIVCVMVVRKIKGMDNGATTYNHGSIERVREVIQMAGMENKGELGEHKTGVHDGTLQLIAELMQRDLSLCSLPLVV